VLSDERCERILNRCLVGVFEVVLLLTGFSLFYRANSLLHFSEFVARLRVMESLGYISAEGADLSGSGNVDWSRIKVRSKGRVARELNSLSSELCATEMVFSDELLVSLTPPEAAALLSTMIFEERLHGSGSDELDSIVKMRRLHMPTPRLDDARHQCLDIGEGLAALQMQCGVATTTDEFIEATFNFGLVDVVFEWARGMSFSDIMAMSGDRVPEGSIVRCMTRLDEVCKQIGNAAEIVGNDKLVELMDDVSELLRRDIVFAGSLYV
jgi:antiviral helicase SKI2